jgi:hypothetical protein
LAVVDFGFLISRRSGLVDRLGDLFNEGVVLSSGDLLKRAPC